MALVVRFRVNSETEQHNLVIARFQSYSHSGVVAEKIQYKRRESFPNNEEAHRDLSWYGERLAQVFEKLQISASKFPAVVLKGFRV